MLHSDAIVSTRSLTYRYPAGERPALNHLDIEIRSGEYVAVLGANGSGKSTFLKLLAGLLKPDFGSLRVCGSEDPLKVRGRLAVVLQNPDDQIVGTVAEEDVAFGPENLGLGAAEIERRVSASLAAVGLSDSRKKPPHFLSGGERQRLALAGALAMEAPVLILDEAASMLDPEGRRIFLDLLDTFASSGKTILHVTHSMEEASRAGRVLVFEEGRLVFDGTPAQLFACADLERWSLALPEALACARALGSRGLHFVPSSLDPERFAEELSGRLRGADLSPLASAERAAAAGTGCLRAAAPAGGSVSASDAALRFSRVTHTYLKGTAFSATAIKDVSLAVGRCRTLAVVGPSGSGKSTLLRHGNAVLLPQEGRVRVFGNDTLDPSVSLKDLRMRAALAVQTPEASLFSRYVADDVAYGPRNKGLSGKELVSAVKSAMEHFGLPYKTYRDRETTSLSGGEKRKAALAGVFALEAELYLLDEPSAALDPLSRRLLMDRLLQLPSHGATLASTTHSMEDAVRFDRVAVMKDGALVAEDEPRRLFYDRYDPEWGIALPWAVAAARSLRERGVRVAGRPLDAEELAAAIRTAAGAFAPESASPESQPPLMLDDLADARPRGRRRGAGIEFFRNAVLGQFLDRPSPIRDLSPPLKYLGLFVLMMAAIVGSNPALPLAVFALTLVLGLAARVGPRHLLRGVAPALPYLALVAAFQLVFSWPGDRSAMLFRWGLFDVTSGELERSFLLCVRFSALIAVLSLFSAVTPLSEAVSGVSRLLSPFTVLGLPVRDLSMIAAVALRFVPILMEEAERIAVAQLSRGGGYGGRGRVRAGLALTVPLFLRSLERAEALAVAMELRLYGADRSK